MDTLKVAITGATGLIGTALVRALAERGDEVTALSRSPERAAESLGVEAVAWADPLSEPAPAGGLAGRDAVVHLAGEPIAQRWSGETKRAIRDSRELGTRNLVATLAALGDDARPGTLVSGSGTDRYGVRGDERLDEDAAVAEDDADFLAAVTIAWEREALEARRAGMRVVLSRTGVVLTESGGALAKMLPFFRLGVGGPVAGGDQYVSWIDLDDAVGALLFCLDTPAISGPVNVTAPEPVTNRELSSALGRVLHRPAFMPVPAFAIRALYGEMAEVVTSGRRVVPGRLLEHGYEYRRPDLEDALRNATGR
ncbi:MAG: TIGR01777 family oxidoreductase [Thermoleophilaceae bacterium]|nr:TIGR01777 family oxidoreductase [Thermoleophilaceae bacterium]